MRPTVQAPHGGGRGHHKSVHSAPGLGGLGLLAAFAATVLVILATEPGAASGIHARFVALRWTQPEAALPGAASRRLEPGDGGEPASAHGHAPGNHGEGHGHKHSGVVSPAVFFLATFFASALSMFITDLLPDRFRLPHSVILYFMGTFMAWLAAGPCEGSEFGDAIDSFAQCDPKLIFWVFLPALLYEDASGANWSVIQRVFPSALLLAFPGVILNTILTGAFVRYAMSGWSAWSALLLGSILSATDPVAVMAALEALGAPARLSHLISGESLFNDGSGVALFTVFVSIAAGESEFRLGTAIGTLCQLAMGGPLFGIAVAFAAGLWMRRTKSLNIQVLILVFCVYGCFIISEHYLKVSGVLGVAAFGLYMSAVGHFSISTDNHLSIHTVMSFLSLISHESIFTVAGIIGYKFMIDTKDITGRDWLDLFLLYLFLHASRALILLLFWPLLRSMGYGISFKEAIICVYGGLRGAVGLAMAAEAGGELGQNNRDAVRIGFLTAGIVVLTLIINGTTITWVYKTLKVDVHKSRRHHERLLKVALHRADTSVMKFMQQFQEHWFFSNCDFRTVELLVPKLSELLQHEELDFFGRRRIVLHTEEHMGKVLQELAKKYAAELDSNPEFVRQHFQAKLEQSGNLKPAVQARRSRSFEHLLAEDERDVELLSEVAQGAVNAMKQEYVEAYEGGRLPECSYRVLLQSIQHQEQAIWGELGVARYGVHAPHFLYKGKDTEMQALGKADWPSQLKATLWVGWLYIQSVASTPQHLALRAFMGVFGKRSIAPDWVLMTRNLHVLLQYITTCSTLLEDTRVLQEFDDLVTGPLRKVMDSAIGEGLHSLMEQDSGMFILLEHCILAQHIVVQMRQIVEAQRAEGTIEEEDTERILKEVIDPTLKAFEELLPSKEQLEVLKSPSVHKVNPKLDHRLVFVVRQILHRT